MIARALLPALVVAIAADLHLSGQERALFSSVSELVVLHVTVKDRHGAYVPDLPRDAFRVYEDDAPQEIRVFTSQDAPVTVGLVIDASASMHPKLDLVLAAAADFVDASNRADDVFGLAFNERTRAVLPEQTPFTSDPAELRAALVANVRARGQTALYDAIADGLDYVGRGHHERKVLIVLSDGADNASRRSLTDVLTRTESSNVVVFAVSLFEHDDADANPKVLKRIAELSGGEAFAPRDVNGVGDVMLHIARDIRNAYTIGYAPAASGADGRFRRIRVEANAPGRRALSVHTRAGYLPR